MSSKDAKGAPFLLKTYLVTYNVLSAIGWAYVFGLTVTHLLNLDGKSDAVYEPHTKTATVQTLESRLPPLLQTIFHRATTAYTRVGVQTAFVQSFAFLEVVHVIFGWVRSPLHTTVMQVSSRLFLVWGITEQFPEVRSNPLYSSMVLAWSLTEIIRYSFYAFNLVGLNPRVLSFLRYTTFYILYPLGASSEAFLIYATLPSSSPIPGWQAWIQGMWKPTDYARALLFAIWWPGLYVMYTYMIVQRRKVLGKPKTLKTN
ncbi:hypothetical protein D9613_000611 [Agrocybe pediades]|uniref:Very-long-chain (3R)-3-hydroxyacyl-CoA dehydratase n=1 Tax=Agrocybe pediades TaxID=84607 RepID=A0A8H4VSS6_9AGAR|nr:hypothetical protein D9613_000611 [Agrocybe pediades]